MPGYDDLPPMEPDEASEDPGAPGLVAELHLTDLGNAGRLVGGFGEDLRRCPVYPGDGWMVWDGHRWESDSTLQVMRYAAKVPADLDAEAKGYERRALAARKAGEDEQVVKFEAMAKSTRGWGRKSESAERQRAMVRLSMADPRVVVRESQLDADPWLLSTTGGTVDLRTGKVRPSAREDLITRVAGCGIAPEGTHCPLWEQTLWDITGQREDLYLWIQKAIGYTLVGNQTEQIVLILHGSGANGKGTFLNTMRNVLGSYARATPAQTFLQKKGESIPNDLAALAGVRLVLAQETEEGKFLDEATVKTVSGGDPISARFLNREWFEFVPAFTLWFSTNHKPTIRGTDRGIWRRLRLIPFNETFEGREDRTLPDRLRAEYPAILRWAVNGCLAWQDTGLQPPADVVAATNEYKEEMDVLAAFLADCCEVYPGASVRNDDIYQAFSDWAKKGGIWAKSHMWLTSQLKERKFKQDPSRKTGRCWQGIALRPECKPARNQDSWFGHGIDA